MKASFYRELDHTADLCLAVWGATRADLYANAALALGDVLEFSFDEPSLPVQQDVTLTAPDPETLMIDWLSELLFWSEQNRAAWQRIELLSASPIELRARVLGIEPARARREIKAVTYTGLRVLQGPDGRWTATITFDI